MATVVLAIGTDGLTLPDIGLRHYRSGRPTTATGTPVLAALGSGDYRLSGLLDKPNSAVTWEYPAGVGGSYVYEEAAGAPVSVIAPIRDAGLDEADLELKLYLYGQPYAVTFDFEEVGTGGGDYRIAGWPMDVDGEWTLTWRYAGISYTRSWTVTGVATSGCGGGIVDELVAAVEEVFCELGDMAKVTLRRYRKGVIPSAVRDGAQQRLPAGAPFVVTGILARRGGGKTGGTAEVFLDPASINDAGVNLANPGDEWTVQEIGGPELELTGDWRPFGPAFGAPILWKGMVSTGA